jgi:hypothetical protein
LKRYWLVMMMFGMNEALLQLKQYKRWVVSDGGCQNWHCHCMLSFFQFFIKWP